MGAGNCSGTNTYFERLNVADNENNSDLSEQSKVGNLVIETLLSKREGAGLANEQVCHLSAHDRNQEGSLGIFVRFSSVTDLIISHIGDSPELGNTLILGVPSTL